MLTLGNYYDALFADEAGTNRYAQWIRKNKQGTRYLDVACGSGDLLHVLRDDFRTRSGLDVDTSMLARAKEKYPDDQVDWLLGDIRSFTGNKLYDTVSFVGDSLNYLLTEEDLACAIHNLAGCCQAQGKLLLDMHHPQRLIEFTEPYVEEGQVMGTDYLWQVSREKDMLLHTLIFYGPVVEQMTIQQRVWPEALVLDLLSQWFEGLTVYTDFDLPATQSGEKIMMMGVCK